MWTSLENWQLTQLMRMATLDPDRVETLMNHLFGLQPTLLTELAIAAVDQEELSVAQAAAVTGLSEEMVEQQLFAYRHREVRAEAVIVVDEDRNLARLAEGQVAVWEIVRAYRQKGSVAELTRIFPGLTMRELMAALTYAESHPDEIEERIQQFEDMRQRRQIEYPFTR